VATLRNEAIAPRQPRQCMINPDGEISPHKMVA